jgi:hypothetical protein
LWRGVRDTLSLIYGRLKHRGDRLAFKTICKDVYFHIRGMARVAVIRNPDVYTIWDMGPSTGSCGSETMCPFRVATTIEFKFSTGWMPSPPPPGWIARNFPSATSIVIDAGAVHRDSEMYEGTTADGLFGDRLIRFISSVELGISAFKGCLTVLSELVRLRPTLAEWRMLRSAEVDVHSSTRMPADLHASIRSILAPLGEACCTSLPYCYPHPYTGGEIVHDETMAELSKYPGQIHVGGEITRVALYSWPNASSFDLGGGCCFTALNKIHAAAATTGGDSVMRAFSKLRLGYIYDLPEGWPAVLADVCPRLAPVRAAELILRSLNLAYDRFGKPEAIESVIDELDALFYTCVQRDPLGIAEGLDTSLMEIYTAAQFERSVARREPDPVTDVIAVIAAAQLATARPLPMREDVRPYLNRAFDLAIDTVDSPGLRRALVMLLHTQPLPDGVGYHRATPEEIGAVKGICTFIRRGVYSREQITTVAGYLAMEILLCRDMLRDNIGPVKAYPTVVTLRDDPESISAEILDVFSQRRSAIREFLTTCNDIMGSQDSLHMCPVSYRYKLRGAIELAAVCKEVLQTYIDGAPPALGAALVY